MKKIFNLIFWTGFFIGAGFLLVKFFTGKLTETVSAEIEIDHLQITIKYNTISSGGRPVFGYLVPYDIVWRAGSKDATVISFSADCNFGGEPVKQGEYSLWAIPSEDNWVVILNRETGQYGTSYNSSMDYKRVRLKPRELEEKEEKLNFSFIEKSRDSGALQIRWDDVLVEVPVSSGNLSISEEKE